MVTPASRVPPTAPPADLWPGGGWGMVVTRTSNSLQRAGISTVGELAGHTAAELLDLPHFGTAQLAEVQRALREAGHALAEASPAAAGERRGALFSNNDVMRAAAITYRQLDLWVRHGFLHPVPGEGYGGSPVFRRRWTRSELAVARLTGRLTAAGLPVKLAARVARSGESRCEIAPGIVIEVTR